MRAVILAWSNYTTTRPTLPLPRAAVHRVSYERGEFTSLFSVFFFFKAEQYITRQTRGESEQRVKILLQRSGAGLRA
jgi:hypothetical protein